MSNFESPVGKEQSISVSESNNESSLEKKRQEAETIVLEIFSEKLQAPMEHSFKKGGRVYENTCVADCMVGSAQHAACTAQEVLDSVRETENYHQEKVAAQLLQLLESREVFSKNIAGLSKEFAEKLVKQFPEVGVILERAENDNRIIEEGARKVV